MICSPYSVFRRATPITDYGLRITFHVHLTVYAYTRRLAVYCRLIEVAYNALMLVIKRYPNRKLYNTETKRYITLDGIATLIRDETDLKVIDHTSGEDLTTLTLTQIIFEQEKKSSGFLPQSVLTGLIQSSGQRFDSLRKSLTAPLEKLNPLEAEIDRRIQALVKQGEMAREEGIKMRDKLLTNFPLFDLRGKDEDSAKVSEEIVEVVEVSSEEPAAEADASSPEDIQNLTAQLDMLTEKVNALLAEKDV